ncbi:CPBP family intramembrane glutamic endopeptidase [Enterobacter ludwigii]|uniref:CPBP family intramembrane glutamic endopeptidase n=1 Tax=Enterobacter ludwigii TaxID=299767 RepID=UPI0015F47BA3|nr:CPBP family intramembrane metalloprotease [Enterobacter sp. RHBSTW-00974]MBA7774848.1 CPBP family intramembrane metalloprotease [Enterobacter sp. RHBSTW-00318]MBA7828313.1 CPBP family intramembrane metalloprotease [Enterobacter sp. RHBSTW-00340]MBA8036106.1 CPBP family intramembrane metalloprotease [Enterobacter sp. RHBSTW-00131]
MGEISVKTGNNARNGGKNSLNRLIRCVCGKKIGPDPRNFNQRVSLGRNDLLIRTFPSALDFTVLFVVSLIFSFARLKSGSLLPSIILHSFMNCFVILLSNLNVF